MKTGCNTFLLDKVKNSLLSLNNNVLIKQEHGKQVVSLLRPTENESFLIFFSFPFWKDLFPGRQVIRSVLLHGTNSSYLCGGKVGSACLGMEGRENVVNVASTHKSLSSG